MDKEKNEIEAAFGKKFYQRIDLFFAMKRHDACFYERDIIPNVAFFSMNILSFSQQGQTRGQIYTFIGAWKECH